jgi:hypothetical protein
LFRREEEEEEVVEVCRDDESIGIVFSPDRAKKKVGMDRLCSVSDLSENRPTAVILRRRIVSGRGGANMLLFPLCLGSGLYGLLLLLLGNTVDGGGATAPPSQDVAFDVERVEELLPSFSSLMKYREDDDHELMIAAAAGRRIWCPIMAGIDDAILGKGIGGTRCARARCRWSVGDGDW